VSFTSDLSRFENKVKNRLLVVPRKVALEVLRRVVMRTPVESGRARGNWQTSVGAPMVGETGRTDKSGGAVIGSAVPIIESWDASNVAIFLMNNVPYIQRLEDGYSDQAPSGMVKITVAEFQGIVEAIGRASE